MTIKITDLATIPALAAGDALEIVDVSDVTDDSAGSSFKVTISQLDARYPAGPVDSVFSRTGAVVAAASDYDASQVDNDSGVAGATVAAALDTLDAGKTDDTTVNAHIADAVDAHDASAISNVPSGNLTATEVQAAIDELEANKANLEVKVQTDATTTRTLGLGDEASYIRFTNAGAITVTVPTNAATAFPIGTQVHLRQAAAGQITVSGTPTINAPDTAKTRKQHASVTLIKVATDEWDLMGDLAAA